VRLLGRYLNSATEVEQIRRLCKRALSHDVRRSAPTSSRGPALLTQDQNEEIATLYEAGWRPADIARAIGTTEWTVHHRLNRNGIERRPIGMTDAECREAVRLYRAKESMRQISLKLGYNDKTIKKALNQVGLEIRESPRHRRS
jgi:DNA-binding NarL/FixJ family response regulator